MELEPSTSCDFIAIFMKDLAFLYRHSFPLHNEYNSSGLVTVHVLSLPS